MKIYIYLSLFLILSVFFACNNKEEVNNNFDSRFSIENGYLKFESVQDYYSIVEDLSKKSEYELISWNKELPFKSLYISNIDERTSSENIDLGYDVEVESFVEENDYNSFFTSLCNENGVFLLADTVVKIKDDYMYKIPHGDVNLISKMDSKKELELLSNVVSFQYYTCKSLEVYEIEPDAFDGRERLFDERTNVCNTTNTTRTFVKFISTETHISGTYIHTGFYMYAYFQKKVLVWLTPARCPINYGGINIRGTVGDRSIYSETSYHSNNSWKYLGYNEEEIKLDINTASSTGGLTPSYNLTIEFDYKKDCNEGKRTFVQRRL